MGAGKNLLLVNYYSPGDVLMLTAAVRDLHRAYPGQYNTDVDTRCPDLWVNNPYLTPVDRNSDDTTVIDCGYPTLLDGIDHRPRHYIEAYHEILSRKLERPVPLSCFAADMHLCDEEAASPPAGLDPHYWVVIAGGKNEMAAKWWPTVNYQAVVDHFADRIRFVQAGAAVDHHPPLRGVKNLVGQTSLREFVRLIYHCAGVICPVTCAMHLAATFGKPCVVIAGGREPPQWEAYPGHQFLHTVGQLRCCLYRGCWKSQVTPIGSVGFDSSCCERPTPVAGELAAACMAMIEPTDVIRAVSRYTRDLNGDSSRLTDATAAYRFSAAAATDEIFSEALEDRGIVIAAGGTRYFTCAWVCIQMLRRLGCRLPVELWHLDSREMTDEMRQLVEPLDVRCVNAAEVRQRRPVRNLGGYELKPYAILNSRFAELLLLDADNVPVVDPSFLFDTPEYQQHGAVFWPDYSRFEQSHPIWRLAGIPPRQDRDFESGQILVDRRRCTKALGLTMWMNQHSDFWYQHIHGDKDTFHLAWRKLGLEYAMPSHDIHSLPDVMCQHDFSGRRIFQHRNLSKWSIDGPNPPIPGFLYEEECLAHLDDLRKRWVGREGRPYSDAGSSEAVKRVARALYGTRWNYHRVGYDVRPMTFSIDGRIEEGRDRCELTWNIRTETGHDVLSIHGEEGYICRMNRLSDVHWRGQWLMHERMAVELTPFQE